MPQFSDGVAMLYPSKVSGQSYVMPSNISSRRGTGNRYDSGRIILLADNDGQFDQIEPRIVQLTDNNNVQINIITSKGYGSSIIETDRSKLSDNKFMQDNNDWHNVEITIVFKYTGGADLSSIILGARSGLGKLDPCQGFAYKAGLILDGLSGFISKQQYYPEGNEFRLFNTAKMGASIRNRFVALKLCVYDLNNQGLPAKDSDEADKVKIEFYGSIDARNPFRILKETVDDGDWGKSAVCGGEAGLIGLWGGPVCTVEWRDQAGIQIQSLSIREIDPNGNFDDTLQPTSLTFIPVTPDDDPEEEIPPGGGSGTDTFGITKLSPTKSGGRVWDSNWHTATTHQWTSAGTSSSNRDAQDNLVDLHCPADNVAKVDGTLDVMISGPGEAAGGGNTSAWRIYVNDPAGVWAWQPDVEITVYYKAIGFLSAGSGTHLLRLNGPTEHQLEYSCSASGHGYGLENSHSRQTIHFRKELAHDFYGIKQMCDITNTQQNVWIGLKFRQRRQGNNAMLLEAFMDLTDGASGGTWNKIGEFLDTGNWPMNEEDKAGFAGVNDGAGKCAKVNGQQAVLNFPASSCYLRVDNYEIQFKKYSIREIDPIGFSDAEAQSVSALAVETTDVSTGAVNDELGVQQIYKTKPGGSVWMSPSNGLTSDSQFSDNGASVKSNGDGTYTVNGKSRIQSFCSSAAGKRGPDYDGYTTHNFNELKKRGAWDDPNVDWRDVEMTAYVKMSGAGSGTGDEVSWVVRSVRHNSGSNSGCGGSSYHGNLIVTGFPRFKKEDWHVSYQNDGPGPKGIGNVEGKTVGLKFICYNLADNESVKLEIWMDKNNDNHWEMYHEKLDAGDWTSNGPDMKHCGALSNTAAILWGSPKVIWKWNDPLKVTISKMSVREIIPEREDGTSPPDTGGGGGGDTGGGTGGTGQLSRILTRYTAIYDVIVNTTGQTCAGASPPSGSGSYTAISGITVTTITNPKELAVNWEAEDNRTEVGWVVNSNDSKLKGTKPTRVGVYLRKIGSPTGTLHVRVRDNSGNQVLEYGSGLDVSTLTGSYVLHETEFTNDSAPTSLPNGLQTGWMISVEWDDNSGTQANHVEVGVNYNNPIDGSNTILFQWETEPGPAYSLLKFNTRDMAGKVYTSP